ncbi:flavin reductase family protein [Pedobacter borealis]|uniref:flavin reductase family protein n=1 Tax=Pedobacter borealis TaxID=475254 RepID=UPI000493A988|nr:iron-sulfur cluster-binding domain-containing protein [Pedobacter borealis]
MKNYTLKVHDIKKETKDTITLCFKQPGLKKIKYQAGQYLTLSFRINGRRYIRPYSFSSAPATDQHLEVTIKRVLNGIVSNHIHDVVSVGDSIEVIQPMGDFTCENQNSDIFLWGVGSGITPLISLAKEILATSEIYKVHLFYGNRNHESTIFLNQIEQFLADYPKRFIVKHFHTKLRISQSVQNVVEGRIDKKKAIEILQQFNLPKDAKHYICGPVGLKESVKLALKEFDISDNNIFSEDFELVKNPADFKNIHTQNIQIQFEGKEHHIEVTKGKSILEAALDADLELPYSCQTGNCSTCKGKLTRGEAKMIGLSKVREDLNEDEFLLCCTHPLTDNVHIEI